MRYAKVLVRNMIKKNEPLIYRILDDGFNRTNVPWFFWFRIIISRNIRNWLKSVSVKIAKKRRYLRLPNNAACSGLSNRTPSLLLGLAKEMQQSHILVHIRFKSMIAKVQSLSESKMYNIYKYIYVYIIWCMKYIHI